MTCEMTVNGRDCANPVWRAVGMIDTVTDRYTRVLMSCKPCACAAMDAPSLRFRVLDLDLAHRLRNKADANN